MQSIIITTIKNPTIKIIIKVTIKIKVTDWVNDCLLKTTERAKDV